MARAIELRNGGSFNFVFSPATETKMKNIYQGMIQGSRKATYHLMTEVEALNWSCAIRFPIDHRSIYLLKADCVYKLENDQYIVFTDPVEDTLHSYVKKNEKNILDPNTGEATEELKMILRDVVKGLTFLRKEHNREHGNLSEHSIYVVNGRGRLGRFYMDPPPAHLKAKANLFPPEMLMHS